MNDLISIIVPVYNNEAYIEQCLKSIMNQTYKNIEIIVVDDGSTDNSIQKCEELRNQDNRIAIYQKAHEGVCRARKFAVRIAQGKYIGFVDSDDWIEADYYQKLYEALKDENELTVAVCGYTKEDLEKQCINYEKCEEKKYTLENMDKLYKNIMLPFQSITPMLWNKLFHNNNLFQRTMELVDESLHMASDSVMTYTYILFCNSITIIDEAGYHYRKNFASVTESSDDNFLKNVNDFYNNMKRNISGHYMEKYLTENLKVYVISLLRNRINYKLDLPERVRIPKYYYPWYGRFEGKKVILYGAGEVGKEYYDRMILDKECEVVLWCDAQYEKYRRKNIQVENPRKINQVEYDAIIIGVKDKSVAEEIKNMLIEENISENLIFWNKTKLIGE